MSSEAATSATLRKHLGCPNATLARASTLRALGIVTLTITIRKLSTFRDSLRCIKLFTSFTLFEWIQYLFPSHSLKGRLMPVESIFKVHDISLSFKSELNARTYRLSLYLTVS